MNAAAPPVRLRRHQEWTVYAVAAILWLSGAVWLLLEYFVRVEGAFGPVHHPWQGRVLAVHGVLSAFALWGFGVLWTFHIRRAWRLRRHRRSGGTMFGVALLLTLTGLLLYYAPGDQLRDWSSVLHWVVGLGAAGALVVHAIVIPRRERSQGPAR